MFGRINWKQLWEVIRFYQAAAINTLFGFSAYALFVWLGLNIYVSQAIAHVLGVAFNYFTYSRHVFQGFSSAKGRFIMSYGVAYGANLAALAIVARFFESPYLAGLIAAMIVSIANFFVLKRLVFRSPVA